jgi:hypothetical protein
MAWMFVMGPCYACGQPFTYNADHVPSVPGHLTTSGTREPVCRACIERANPERVKNGLEPIVPHPDAYEPEEVA